MNITAHPNLDVLEKAFAKQLVSIRYTSPYESGMKYVHGIALNGTCWTHSMLSVLEDKLMGRVPLGLPTFLEVRFEHNGEAGVSITAIDEHDGKFIFNLTPLEII